MNKKPISSNGDVIISFLEIIDNSRQTNFCLGALTDFGILTVRSCCPSDEISIYDLEKSSDIEVQANSILIEADICFINTTSHEPEFNFIEMDSLSSVECSIKVLHNQNGELREQSITIDIETCEDNSCWTSFDYQTFVNDTVLIGSPVTCFQSIFGIVDNGKLFSSNLTFSNDCFENSVFSLANE